MKIKEIFDRVKIKEILNNKIFQGCVAIVLAVVSITSLIIGSVAVSKANKSASSYAVFMNEVTANMQRSYDALFGENSKGISFNAKERNEEIIREGELKATDIEENTYTGFVNNEIAHLVVNSNGIHNGFDGDKFNEEPYDEITEITIIKGYMYQGNAKTVKVQKFTDKLDDTNNYTYVTILQDDCLEEELKDGFDYYFENLYENSSQIARYFGLTSKVETSHKNVKLNIDIKNCEYYSDTLESFGICFELIMLKNKTLNASIAKCTTEGDYKTTSSITFNTAEKINTTSIVADANAAIDGTTYIPTNSEYGIIFDNFPYFSFMN